MTQFPTLHHSVAFYLSMDWPEDFGSFDNALAAFVRDDRASVNSAIAELEDLIGRGYAEAELEELAAELGWHYHPPGDGLTYREWFPAVLSKLRSLQVEVDEVPHS